MQGKEKSVRRAELLLILLLLLVILVTQLTGPGQTDDGSGEQKPLISSAADLKGMTFVCVMGSAYDQMIPRLFPGATVSYVTDWSEECVQIRQGKADAMLWEASSLNELHEVYDDLTELPEPVGQLPFHWATRKDGEGERLCREINTFIDTLQGSGELEAVYRRWEDPETAPSRVEAYPMTGTPRGKLRAVTCLDWQPVCYLNQDQPCGYMMELLMRFCAWAGYEPELENVDIQSMQAGFLAGKYDLLVYGLDVREEAGELLNYTRELMTDDLYAVVAKDRYVGTASAGERRDSSEGRLQSLWRQLMTSLDRNFLRENRWRMLLSGLGVTVLLSLLSVLAGTVLGGLICAMRLSRRALPQAFARLWIRGIQGMPIVLMLLILYYVIFQRVHISAFPVCVLGFSLDFSAYAAEMFRSGIEAVPRGQISASRALGFSSSATFRHVVFPQMVIHCLPVYMGQVISTVKLTSVAGYISVMDLTRVSDLIRSRTYEAFFPLFVTAVVYFLVASLLILLLRRISGRLDPAVKARKIRGVKEHADEG